MSVSLMRLLPLLLAVLLVCAVQAQDAPQDDSQRYVVDIELQTIDEFQQLLERAEQLLLDGTVSQEDPSEVTFLLHGPVLRSLLRQNYLSNKATVDLAASLSALGVIDIKACRTWMGGNGVDEEDLQPFIETVAYATAELQRLRRENNYLYF